MRNQKTYDVFAAIARPDGFQAMKLIASMRTRFQGKKALNRIRRKGISARLMIGNAVQ
ncbi:MAG: hypothetical protein PHQ05_13230 [Sterolibacterium sp.]|nr:hypothetical protein [Sterolibacterium sp.]